MPNSEKNDWWIGLPEELQIDIEYEQ